MWVPPCPQPGPPSRPRGGGASRGLLTQNKDVTVLVSQDPHPEAQDHRAQDLEEKGAVNGGPGSKWGERTLPSCPCSPGQGHMRGPPLGMSDWARAPNPKSQLTPAKQTAGTCVRSPSCPESPHPVPMCGQTELTGSVGYSLLPEPDLSFRARLQGHLLQEPS